jgi:DNA-binding response OmpR family regulator
MYQAALRPTVDGSMRVVLVIDVPAGTADLCSRTAELADDYARVIAMSVPGVRPRKAVVEPAVGPASQRRDGLLVDHVNRQVHVDGRPVRLAYREFELLAYLSARAGSTVSRQELVRDVWHDAPGSAAGVSVRTVDTHVRRLRVKLGRYQAVLTSVRGHGYRFEARPDVRVVSAALHPPRAARLDARASR